MRDHEQQDETRFNLLEGQQQRMVGQLDVLVDNQMALMGAFGMRKDEDNQPHRPVALMRQSELIWKIGGAMGGLLIIYKGVFAVWPFAVGALKALTHIQ